LTEAPLIPSVDREHMGQLMFETFGTPFLCLGDRAVLSLVFSGRTTGTVLESGDGAAYAVPVVEGSAATENVLKIDIAGSDPTSFTAKKLAKRGYSFAHDRGIAEHVKRSLCYVACLFFGLQDLEAP
jgi:actin-related protein